MSEKSYNSAPIPGMQGLSLRAAMKKFGADEIGIKKVKSTSGDGRPDFVFLMVDGTSMGQASENIRKSGKVPADAVISGFRDKNTGADFYILHAQGAGETNYPCQYEKRLFLCRYPGSSCSGYSGSSSRCRCSCKVWYRM